MITIVILSYEKSAAPAQVRIKGQMEAKVGMEIVDEGSRFHIHTGRDQYKLLDTPLLM